MSTTVGFVMSEALLVVDGKDRLEDGEGQLVEHIARRRFDHVVRLPYLPTTTRAWSVVWFCGHLTAYRKARVYAAEVRRQATYYRIATLDELCAVDTKLLVLSTCYAGRFVQPRATTVSYRGALAGDDGMVFAARFMWHLTDGALTPRRVREAFARAKTDRSWRLDVR